MKKTFLLFTATLFMLANAGIFAQNTNGTIRELNGTVELKFSGSADYVAAKTGDTVRQDTVISTGFKSTALIEIGSAVIAVRPLTRLTLTEIQASEGTESLNMNLQTGRVKIDLNPPAGTKASLSTNSPSATASVRGTSFEFDTKNLRVHEGSVGFAGNRGQSVWVSAGSDSQVRANGEAADPVEIKIAALLPPAPVGADPSSGGGKGKYVRKKSTSSTNTTITIEYN